MPRAPLSARERPCLSLDEHWPQPRGLTLRFCIDRRPVSTNQQYYRRSLDRGGKGLGSTEEARLFKSAVSQAALAARQRSKWPRPELVRQAALSVVVFNSEHDCSAAEKLTADGLEDVLYDRDKVAFPRLNTLAIDDGPPRVEVAVTLLREGPPPPRPVSRRSRRPAKPRALC